MKNKNFFYLLFAIAIGIRTQCDDVFGEITQKPTTEIGNWGGFPSFGGFGDLENLIKQSFPDLQNLFDGKGFGAFGQMKFNMNKTAPCRYVLTWDDDLSLDDIHVKVNPDTKIINVDYKKVQKKKPDEKHQSTQESAGSITLKLDGECLVTKELAQDKLLGWVDKQRPEISDDKKENKIIIVFPNLNKLESLEKEEKLPYNFVQELKQGNADLSKLTKKQRCLIIESISDDYCNETISDDAAYTSVGGLEKDDLIAIGPALRGSIKALPGDQVVQESVPEIVENIDEEREGGGDNDIDVKKVTKLQDF